MKINFEISDKVVELVKKLDGILCYRDVFCSDPADIELVVGSYLFDKVIIDIEPDGQYHIFYFEKDKYAELGYIKRIYDRLDKYMDRTVTEEELIKFLSELVKEEEKNENLKQRF